jgi:hypothetical protein
VIARALEASGADACALVAHDAGSAELVRACGGDRACAYQLYIELAALERRVYRAQPSYRRFLEEGAFITLLNLGAWIRRIRRTRALPRHSQLTH